MGGPRVKEGRASIMPKDSEKERKEGR